MHTYQTEANLYCQQFVHFQHAFRNFQAIHFGKVEKEGKHLEKDNNCELF